MKATFRIFNNIFSSDEWFVVAEVPDNFAYNIHLNDMICPSVLFSLPEFDIDRFLESLREEDLKTFKENVAERMNKYNLTQIKAELDVYHDWMYDLNLTVTVRKWCYQRNLKEFYLQFWLQDDCKIHLENEK